ncbi:caspase domain-containing protein [Gymnopilus junonius]|uniref:Caspase domain-containing protein n=1 Tax=Gymnopilus junonius TaxID=109634 RepID=A0A9P5NER9_GYMJU|nr:caspase domain-containing protein [Gymnopilus junonius]
MSSPQNWNGTNFSPSSSHLRIPNGSQPDASSFIRHPQNGPLRRLFALIIGINTYKCPSFRALRGAEPDALAFKDYFERWLGVPTDHIALLLGREATRLNVIQGFKRLAKDHRIQPGDPIVIFFAGHGGEVLPRNGWEAGGKGSKIQMLVPYDCSSEAGQGVPAIPDHTIGALIGQISREKGDNIAIIVDCCHSASATRAFPSSDFAVRSVILEPAMYNHDIDESIFGSTTRAVRPTPQYQHGGSKSHMLLAACGSSEKAVESDGHGNFSAALLKLLQTTPPDQLRHRDVLDFMEKIPGQNPQCEGDHPDRLLFSMAELAKPTAYSIRPASTFNFSSIPQFILDAGSAHGITPGSQFSIYGEKVKLMASAVNAFNSVLEPLSQYSPHLTTSQPTTAVLTQFGPGEHMRLFIPAEDPFQGLFRHVCNSLRDGGELGLNNIILVPNPSIAHLGARMDPSGRNVVFNILDERATRYGFSHPFDPVLAEVDSVARVLSCARHFFRTLHRSSNPTGEGSQVHIEFYQLQETSRYSENGEIMLIPTGPNLCQHNGIDFTTTTARTPYGFKIINNSPHRFYAYLFYFDFGDLSITPFYQTPAAPQKYQADFSLRKKGGSLTIGYGSGGVTPFSFVLREGHDVDVGFLKLFVSTKPIDLNFIPQGSPFSNSSKALQTWEGRKGDLWDDLLVPFILRRG